MTSNHAIAWTFRLIVWTTAAWLLGWRGVLLLGAAAVLTHGAALAVHALRPQPASRAVLGVAVSAELLLFASTFWPVRLGIILPVGVGVFMCHAIAYLVDVHRGAVVPTRHVSAFLYVLQLPVFPAGPLSRFHEFDEQLWRGDVSMAGFSYGVRRIVTGLTKVYLLAGPLASTASAIFALRVTKLSIDTAWLGAICASLEAYYYLSGFSDIGIGLGKIVGFRYQENFRRPFTADSIRDYWRRWNVTLMTWLRDYAALPIAGHDRPTSRQYVAMIGGFVIVGAWYRPTFGVLPWAVYFASWLAIESIALGTLLLRAPRIARHLYVLAVVGFGWMLLRASGPGPLLGYVEAMLGGAIQPFGASADYLTLGMTTALICAIVFAGPMIGNVSRWRVSVDAAVASLIMMFAATAVLLWHVANPLRRLLATPRHKP